jgi:putative transposase
MPWKEICAVDQRMRLVAEYELDDLSMAELCRKYNVSRKTGYKWLGRIAQEGLDGLKDRSRAPHHHANEVVAEIEQAVLELRAAHPTWGPKKLLRRLQNEDSQVAWPARSTIAELLRRRGLVVPRKRRRRVPPHEQPFAACQGSNAIWCVDFKGWFRTGDGQRCDPLTISDAFSRYLIRCQAVPNTGIEGVQPLFEAAFREYGLPGAIRSDNGVPFASHGIGGLSRLSVWWIKLGIMPERIEAGKPQQNGRHERMHLTLKKETASPPAATVRGQQQRFDAFRREFNQERPHEALDLATPASKYECSPRPYPSRLLEITYPPEWVWRVVRPCGQVRLRGRQFFLGEALIGEVVGLEPLNERYWRTHFGPVALGIYDEHRRRVLRPWEVRQAGLRVAPIAGKPPSAALQEAFPQLPKVLPMCLD